MKQDKTGGMKAATRVLIMAAGVWTFVLAVWLYYYSVRHGGIPCWDGYERCAWASQIWHDIRHFDFLHFWRHTNYQVVWPFLHSWITGMVFVFFGPSLAAARLVSLFAFIGTAFLILAWFGKRRDSYSWAGGITAWLLFTMSPIVIQHAVGIMSELFGLFLAAAVLIALPEERDANVKRAGLCGGLLALFFFYKYNFAFLTYSGLLLNRFVVARYSFREMWNRQNALIFGIPIVLMGLWFIPDSSRKIDNLIYFAANNPSARMPFSFASLFYYPKVIPSAYYPFAPLFAVSAVSIAIALLMGGRLSLKNPITACLIVHFLAAVIHPMKMPRFQFISMGFFFILTGEAVQTYLAFFSKRYRKITFSVTASLLAFAIALCAMNQSNVYRSPQLPQENVYISPIKTLASQFDDSDRFAILSTHELVNPPAITFYFMASLDNLQKDLRTNASRWDHIFLFRTTESIRSLTLEDRIKHLRHELFIHRSNAIMTVENINPGWNPKNDPIFGGVYEVIQMLPSLTEYIPVFEKEFPRSKTRVRIYRSAPQDPT